MCAGVLPLFLLDGQFFTHSLVALPFFLAATAVSALSVLDSRIADEHKRAWMLATLLPALLVIGLLAGLRSSYRAQSNFNDAIRRLHEGSKTRPARSSSFDAWKLWRYADVRQPDALGRFAIGQALRCPCKRTLLGLALGRVIAKRGGRMLEHDTSFAHPLPIGGLHSEASGARCDVDSGRFCPARPVKGSPRGERIQDSLGERDMARERRMHRINEQVIAQKSMRPDGVEQGLTIDQDAVVLCGDLAEGVLERRQAACRESVEIAGHDKLVVGFAPFASTFEQPAEAVMGFCETGL